ncbi:hypothetical protein SAMN05216257_104332 [Meinhardsimonia xiamenensis]|jgi:hypothetical protein|uniref:Uncharacterized protein n=1 Tax=Meinhardsimonia xiamenensis TaxID=990712 RepID=A0A1G9EIS7_9RHOB|nr:hypothetical protein [Meinhardsimonia xiamenensis]PRX33752.1 hypothetical protein LV81_02182 [Meinhardsimonia xiamenensis]SDK75951.1 hypothetical protein SAMN05216257_104332 [Meinhardsimonia xiamenensis]
MIRSHLARRALWPALAVCLALAPGEGAEAAGEARAAAEEALTLCLQLPAGRETLVAKLEENGWKRGGEAELVTFTVETALAFVFDPEAPEETAQGALFVATMLNKAASPEGHMVLTRAGVTVAPLGLGDDPYCALSGPEVLAEAARSAVAMSPQPERSSPVLVMREGSPRMTLAVLQADAMAAAISGHVPDEISGSSAFSFEPAYVQVLPSRENG